MRDEVSQQRAVSDWETVQANERRMFKHAPVSGQAYRGVQAQRITANIHILEELEVCDAQVPDGPRNAPGRGRWPFR